jgi:FdhD protein
VYGRRFGATIPPVESVERERIRVWEGDREADREDALAVEEPLLVRIRRDGETASLVFATTMRTPGHDEELAAGLLHGEGALRRREDLVSIARADDPALSAEKRGNALVATLSPEAFERARALRRETVTGSACGVCGSLSIEEAVSKRRIPVASELRVSREILYALPAKLREEQSVFSSTGGLHAAGLFTAEGAVGIVREDIGRHNATDKVIGAALRRGELPLSERLLLVSGRAGFEIVQKAHAAAIPVVASVSAPSSLAVALADSAGMTLIGFLRERRFNVYAHPERVRA